MTTAETFLTRKQVGELLNLSPYTLANWACSGRRRGPEPVRFGAAVRYDSREVARYAADPEAYEAARNKRKQRRQRAGRK